MTTAETQAPAGVDHPAPPEEELEKLAAAATLCWEQQASFRLLNPHDALWHEMTEPGVHLITVDGHHGTFDANRATFLPDDWTGLTELLRGKLSESIGDAELAVGDDGTSAVDWQSCEIVEDAPPAIRVTATGVPRADGGYFTLTLLVTPEGEAQVESHELVPGSEEDAADAADEDGPAHGITAAYLGEHYTGVALEFDGRNYLVDWTSWDPDQETDEGLVGSTTTGTGDDGVEYELYVWFDPATGPGIVRAEAAAASEGDTEQAEDDVDPAARFAEELLPELRDRLRGNGSRLAGSSVEYDVSAWVNGDYGGELEFDRFDGTAYLATITASTVEDEPRRVRCVLRIVDPEDVTVESEESIS